MTTPFNPASLPRAWVRQILDGEHDDGRFEQFANEIVRVLEGRQIVATSASWDLGRDGRSVGPGSGIAVLATLQLGIDKPTKDAKRLKGSAKGSAKPKRVYYVTSRPHSDHTLKEHASAIANILGPKTDVEPIGGIQIEDLVSTGKVADGFKKLYAGEIAGIQAALATLDEGEAYLQQLELALSTFGATNSQELRIALATRLILTLLEPKPARIEALNAGASKLLGVDAFSSPTLVYYCDQLRQRSLIDQANGEYRLLEAGRRELAQSRTDAVARELKGRAALRAAAEESLRRTLAEQQWSVIWVSLQNELAKAFYVRGKQILELISGLLGGDTGADRDLLGPVVDTILTNVVERHVAPPDRPIVLRALQDAFLPGNKHGAFEWLSGVAGRFAAICTLGLSQEVITAIRDALRSIRFFFDTDVVISYLCAHEPANAAAHAIVDLGRRLGHQVMVTDAVAEEVARHAMKAHTDYRVRVAPVMQPLEWYELAELESAFTREFEYLRIEGKARPRDWQRFIEQYTGPETRGKPNIAKMRQILSKEGLAIRPPGGEDERWEERRTKLSAFLIESAKTLSERERDVVKDKARIDAEMLIAVARTIQEAESRGTGERYILITSARRLRYLHGGVRKELPYVPEVLSLPEAACIASLLPDRPVSLKALHGLLFEGHFERAVGGLEAVLLQVVRQAGTAIIPGATRGVLLEAFDAAILREAKHADTSKSEVKACLAKDPVAFARVASVALDALALPKPSDREEVLAKMEDLLKLRSPKKAES